MCWIRVLCSHINHLHEPLHAHLSASNRPTSLSVRLSICTKNFTVLWEYSILWCGAAGPS